MRDRSLYALLIMLIESQAYASRNPPARPRAEAT